MILHAPVAGVTERGSRLTAGTARHLTLDAMFAGAARDRPDATAVRVAGGRLTYRGAEQRARQLATLLVRAGLQLSDPVIVHCADHRRSLIAHLAVLKAGGVCVPVPVGTPRTVLSAVAELSGAQAVLCGGDQPAAWKAFGLRLRLDEQDTWQRAESLPADLSLPRSSPIDPAYLLVSRRTGTGHALVSELIDHQAWQLATVARIQRMGAAVHGVEIRQAPGTPVALAAMWWTFASAGTLYCGSADGPLTRSPVTVLDPREYDRLLVPGAIGPRTVLLLGGPCPEPVVERHHEVLPATRLWAEFAPSGGALPWTARELPRGQSAPARPSSRSRGRGGSLSVGMPVPGVRVQVLDEAGNQVVPGSAGEVCAVGPALAFDCVSARADDQGAAAPDPGPVIHSGLRGLCGPDGQVELCAPRAARAPRAEPAVAAVAAD